MRSSAATPATRSTAVPGADQLFGEGGDDSLAAFDNEADSSTAARASTTTRRSTRRHRQRLRVLAPPRHPDPRRRRPGRHRRGVRLQRRQPVDQPRRDRRPGRRDRPELRRLRRAEAVRRGDGGPLTRPTSKGRRIRSLSVTDLRKGTRLQATCKAPKAQEETKFVGPCAFKTKTKTARRATRPVAFTKNFNNRVLPAGTQIQVRITVADRVGKIWIYRINSRTSPRETRRCLTKGNSAKPPSARPKRPDMATRLSRATGSLDRCSWWRLPCGRWRYWPGARPARRTWPSRLRRQPDMRGAWATP